MSKLDNSLSRTRVIYVFTTIFLVAIGVYTFYQVNNLVVASNLVNHTNQVKLSLRQLSFNLVEAETNKRAFWIYNDSLFILKRDYALAQLRKSQSELAVLVADNPDQLAHLDSLNAGIEEKVYSIYDITREAPKSGITIGRKAMEKVMMWVNRMAVEEEQLLRERAKVYSYFSYFSPILIVILFFAALLVLFLSYRRINKALSYAQYMRSKFEAVNAQLEKQNIELAESEERLLKIFDHNPVAMSVGEIGSNKFIYANKMFYAYFGYEESEVLGKTAEELGLTSEEENARNIPIVLSYLDEGVTVEDLQKMSPEEITKVLFKLRQEMFRDGYEVNYTRKDGGTFVALVYFELTEIASKTLAITTYQDITEKKATLHQLERKNKELVESEKRFLNIFQNNPVAMTLGEIGTDQIVDANAMFCNMFGFTKEEVIGNTSEQLRLTSEEENQRLLPIILGMLDESRSVEELQALPAEETAELLQKLREKMFRSGFEVNYLRRNGSEFTALVFYEIISFGEKKFALTSYQDVSERIEAGKRLQEKNLQLQMTNELIREQKEFNETIVNASVDLIAVFDLELRFTSANKAAILLYNKSLEEIIGKRVIDVFPGIAGTGMHEELQTALRGNRVFNPDYVSMIGNRHFENVYIPLLNAQHEVYGVLALGHDITERMNSEKSLRILNDELAKKNDALQKTNRELESFNYIASHDLQEPLRKIQTLSGYLIEKENANLSASGKNYFNRIQASAERMQQLIRDLLGYSRIDAMERNLEEVDLHLLLDDVTDDLKEELISKHATIEASEMCKCNVIRFQFRQLLYNLIGNSLKFSKPDIAPHIQVRSRLSLGKNLSDPGLLPDQLYCHLTIIDNGIGFEPQYKERIFGLFQRLNRKEQYEGTGIGLSIVKKIVDNHKGFIVASGELNEGARFDIYFPNQ